MKIKQGIAVLLLFVPLFVGAQQQWTLQQCVDTALANNRNVKQQALTKKTKEIAYQQARQNLLPNLNASANHGWNFGRTLDDNYNYTNTTSSTMTTQFSISTGVTLFDGLKMKYNIDARKADMYASDAELDKIKQDITLSVATAYLQILLNKELLQIANEQLGLTKTKIEQRKALVESGKMAEGEMYELLAQESKEELTRTQAENTLKLSLLDIAQILELDHFEDLDIVIPENLMESELQLLSAELVYESALKHRPEIIGAEYKLQRSEKEILINKADFYPTLSFGANTSTDYYYTKSVPPVNSFGKQLSDKIKSNVGFSLSIPIFNKFDVRNRVHTAEIGVQSSKLNIDNAKLELKKTIQQAYYNALGAKSRWLATQKSEIASREAFRFANQKFEAGRATSYELYQAKNNLTQVLSEQAQAKYEYVFRVKILELLK